MSVRGGGKALDAKVPDMSGLMDFDEELKTHEQRRKRCPLLIPANRTASQPQKLPGQHTTVPHIPPPPPLCNGFRFTWVHMTQDARDSKEAAVVRDQDRFKC
jgi:hypothetical protein